jgi:hypothetical protein
MHSGTLPHHADERIHVTPKLAKSAGNTYDPPDYSENNLVDPNILVSLGSLITSNNRYLGDQDTITRHILSYC